MTDTDKEVLEELKKLNDNLDKLENTLKQHTDSQYDVSAKLRDLAIVLSNLPQKL